MSLRAIIIGLAAVVLIAALTPYNDLVVGGTYLTGNHFPAGALFILVVLVLVVNVGIKLVWRAWALRTSELMLVWCMMIVASTVPASGLMRYLFPMVASPTYYAARPDKDYESHVLPGVPDDLVVTKDVQSPAVKRFFEGPAMRVPWGKWARPLASWGTFILLFYLATLFLTGLLRKQWVEVERLAFPLARVPLEIAADSAGSGLVPAFLRSRACVVGLTLSLAFGAVRMAPVLTGAAQGWVPSFPVQSFLWGTPIQALYIWSAYLYPMAVGFAFLVPADVALSVWLFFWFTHMELVVADRIGMPIAGGDYSPFMQWQQAGAFIVFTLIMFWMARRHLWDVVRKTFGLDSSVDDSQDPIGYRVGFWGLVLAVIGMLMWYAWHGIGPVVGVLLLALTFCVALVHARLVAQGGIFFVQQSWQPPTFLHGITGGAIFGPAAAVTAQMQNAILVADAREILSGHAVNALRVASAFERRRRWFLPLMLVSLIVALGVSGFFIMRLFYEQGALSTADEYAVMRLPFSTFDTAHMMIDNPAKAVEPKFGAFALGAGIMFAVTMMRMRFYWWPVHSLGFLTGSSWPGQTLWFAFFLGWGLKVIVVKFGGGAALRRTRDLFMGVIIGEAMLVGISAVLGLAGIKVGNLFLPV